MTRNPGLKGETWATPPLFVVTAFCLPESHVRLSTKLSMPVPKLAWLKPIKLVSKSSLTKFNVGRCLAA
jgi:hypothetical protein